ncbi:hypothetical protein Taro_001155 [Colocasia esculenta]|uniref:Beta-carotene isomerase D27-like C-terminal domain-containing protein n=1 Tax=Colocasia esculenta TaxID=4460 RepID=A0A843TH07_COLES|nr:hypothetical protein [Colocasia esculenta]
MVSSSRPRAPTMHALLPLWWRMAAPPWTLLGLTLSLQEDAQITSSRPSTCPVRQLSTLAVGQQQLNRLLPPVTCNWSCQLATGRRRRRRREGAKLMAALLSLPAAGCLRPAYCRGRKRGCASSFRCGIAEPSGVPAPMGQKTQYKDGWFETAFMSLFARKMEKFSGGEGRSGKGMWDWNYDSFVDVSRRVMMGRSRKQQQEVVREVLFSMLPPGAPAQFRKLFPPTKWAAEFNAALTVPFFHWLVGPSEVVEVEVNGVKQRSGVHIKKCRYLENSGCVGMCINMCKIPTQDFFTNEFGLPLTMIPNFEDMSCDMVYGQVPPPFEEDPVSTQPCYANLCKFKRFHYFLKYYSQGTLSLVRFSAGSLANPNPPICPKLQN